MPDTTAAQSSVGIDLYSEGSEPGKGNKQIHCDNVSQSRRTECIIFHGIHGHVKNPDENGISHTRPNNIDIAAITSV